jgi:hypothetical protein
MRNIATVLLMLCARSAGAQQPSEPFAQVAPSGRAAPSGTERDAGQAPSLAAVTVAAPADVSWSRALDALVAGDLDAATAALVLVEADAASSPDRRSEARDLMQRIRKRRADAAATAPTTSPTATTAPMTTTTTTPTTTTSDGEADDRGGRTFLLGTTTLAGLGLWGWTLPMALDIQNDRGFIGLYMVTAGSSFVGPFLLTRKGPVTWGMANMGWLGASRGAVAGIGAGVLLAGVSDRSDQSLAGSALIGSLVLATAATLWGRDSEMSPGTAHATGIGGDVGALTGLAFAHLTGLDLRNRAEADRDQDQGGRMMAGSALVGGALGLLGGHFVASRRAFTWGDAEVMRLPIAIAVDGAAMVMDWSGTDSSRAIVGALTVAGLAGAVVGERLVRDKDYSVGQGFLLDLGTVAGALTAMGSVYLISGSNQSETYLTSSFVGATAAFSILYLTLDAPIPRALAARLTPDGEPATGVALLPFVGSGFARGLALAGRF